MAYDEALAMRIRALLPADIEVAEKPMFGGLAFLVGGNMAVAASGGGGLLVHVDPNRTGELLRSGTAHPMEMRGRELAGWIRVGSEHLRTKRALSRWVALGLDYARALPPKR